MTSPSKAVPLPGVAAKPLGRPQRLTVLAGRLSRTIGVARALASHGRTVDLTGLDDGIGLLCAQTLDLQAEEARPLLPLLHDVLTEVNALSAVLREHAPDRFADLA